MNIENLTVERIKQLAKEKVFSRGRDYFANGRVLEVVKTEDGVIAKVQGRDSSPYSVKIEKEDDRLKSSCSCPYGGFCKHRVAVLLSLLEGSKEVEQVSTGDIRDYLSSKSREELVDVIMDHASSDTDFLRHLLGEVQINAREEIDVSFFRREIDRKMEEAWHVGYFGVSEYALELEQFGKRIRDLVDSGFAEEASELLFYFIEKSIETLENSGIDDSSGSFGEFIISLGEPCAEALKASKDEVTISGEDVVDSYLKAADYGVDDCFYPLLKELPEKTLLSAEEVARERVEEVEDEVESWRTRDERFLLVTILALLGKEDDYRELCETWGEDDWLPEVKRIEKRE